SCNVGFKLDGGECKLLICDAGKHLDTSSSPNTCVDNCTTHDTAKCKTCDSRYELDSNGACQAATPVCVCDHGTVGSTCTVHGSTLCASCNVGFKLDGGECKLLICDAGKHLDTSSSPNTCVDNVCSCLNGVAKAGTDCPMHGAHDCASCSSGYGLASGKCELVCPTGQHLNDAGTACEDNSCSCDFGSAATGAACTSNSANICSSCDSGYHANGNSC
ncbi:unnamed protein product, partial [Amoebophrya sp. A120]